MSALLLLLGSRLASVLPPIAIGTTVILGVASIGLWVVRDVAMRQRIAEFAIASAMIFVGLALVPMPRMNVAETLWAATFRSMMPSRVPLQAESTHPVDESTPVTSNRTPSVENPPAPRAHSEVGLATPMAEGMSQVDSQEPLDRRAAGIWSRPSPWTVAAWGWVAGGTIAALYLLVGWGGLARFRRRARLADDWIAALIDAPDGVSIRVSSAPCRPFCFGIFRPTIVLPEHLCQRDGEERLRWVLRHEAVHLARRDSLGQGLFALALPILFPHPLYWMLRRVARFSAEVIADDVAASSNRTHYARCLVRLATVDSELRSPRVALGVTGSELEFTRRIEMLLSRQSAVSPSCSRWGRVALVASALLVTGATSSSLGARPRVDETKEAELRARIEQVEASNRELREQLEETRARLAFFLEGIVDKDLRSDELLRDVDELRSRPESRVVVVKAGDTLSKITREHLGSAARVDEIIALNRSIDPRRLRVGERIVLPVHTASNPLELPPEVEAAELSDAEREDLTLLGYLRAPERTASVEAPSGMGVFELASRRIDLRELVERAERNLEKALPGSPKEAAERELHRTMQQYELLEQVIASEIEIRRLELESRAKDLEQTEILVQSGYLSAGEINESRIAFRRCENELRVLTGK